MSNKGIISRRKFLKLLGSSATAAALSACGADGKANPQSPSSPGSASCQQTVLIPNAAGAIVAAQNPQQQNCIATATPAVKEKPTTVITDNACGEEVDREKVERAKKTARNDRNFKKVLEEILEKLEKYLSAKGRDAVKAAEKELNQNFAKHLKDNPDIMAGLYYIIMENGELQQALNTENYCNFMKGASSLPEGQAWGTIADVHKRGIASAIATIFASNRILDEKKNLPEGHAGRNLLVTALKNTLEREVKQAKADITDWAGRLISAAQEQASSSQVRYG